MSDARQIARLIPAVHAVTFRPQPPSRDDVVALMQIARLAPSSRNTQIWRYTVIANKAAIRRAAEHLGAGALADAPALIVAQAKQALFKKLQHEQPFLWIDVPISMSHLSLAATERGLALEWRLVARRDFPARELGADPALDTVACGFLGQADRVAPVDALPPGAFHNQPPK
jgi:nitroreductase